MIIERWLLPSSLVKLLRIILRIFTTVVLFSFVQPYSLFDELESEKVHRYNICNGLSNQLLYHSSNIALAIQKRSEEVEIPAYYIVNGVQSSDDDVVPGPTNSVPIQDIFDTDFLKQEIEKMGPTRVRFVEFDFENFNNFDTTEKRAPPACAGMRTVPQADSNLMLRILNAFVPSPQMADLVSKITVRLGNFDHGVCLHHRNGQDWHDHCARWGNIPDGVYRGNCLLPPDTTFMQSLRNRGIQDARWVYYCGDHQIPEELEQGGLVVKSRRSILKMEDVKEFIPRQKQAARILDSTLRDLWALIDFFVCRQVPHFIGNSVSTFSAIQIALREGKSAFWYNSQSIPLAEMWHVFQMPVVYTYTELSKGSGKNLLKASINSVKLHMPRNTIYVLYHGHDDIEFKTWLKNAGVTLHDQKPTWKDEIEKMRKKGDSQSSNLFLHAGNYFGTWQRMDIPDYVQSEYCLLLDSDTIILRPFSFLDFGLNMTHSIAMGPEMDAEDPRPWNAGVMLMNMPYLRQTYNDFLNHVLNAVSTGTFNHSAPSDQGAYLSFYADTVQALSPRLNFKPYWKLNFKEWRFENSLVLHFHGAKPHDYIKHVLGEECDPAIAFLCGGGGGDSLCNSIQAFAKSVDPVEYCLASFSSSPKNAASCIRVFSTLGKPDATRTCYNLNSFVQCIADRNKFTAKRNGKNNEVEMDPQLLVPDDFCYQQQTQKSDFVIAAMHKEAFKHVGSDSMTTYLFVLSLGLTCLLIPTITSMCRKGRYYTAILMLLWVVCNFTLTSILFKKIFLDFKKVV